MMFKRVSNQDFDRLAQVLQLQILTGGTTLKEAA